MLFRSPRAVVAADLAAIVQSKPVVEQVDAQVDRLRERLAHPPSYPPPSRDPFRFGAKKSSAPSTEHSAPSTLAPSTLAPSTLAPSTQHPAPSTPAVRLVAVATNVIDGALVRTVVLSLGDDVVVAKTGEKVGDYSVKTIGIDVVELIEAGTARTFKISLQ